VRPLQIASSLYLFGCVESNYTPNCTKVV